MSAMRATPPQYTSSPKPLMSTATGLMHAKMPTTGSNAEYLLFKHVSHWSLAFPCYLAAEKVASLCQD